MASVACACTEVDALYFSQAAEQLQPAQEPAKKAFTEIFTGIKVR